MLEKRESGRGDARVTLAAFRGASIFDAEEIDFSLPDLPTTTRIRRPGRGFADTPQARALLSPPVLTESSASGAVFALPRFALEESRDLEALKGGTATKDVLVEMYFGSKMFAVVLDERHRLVAQGLDKNKAGRELAGKVFEDLAFRDFALRIGSEVSGSVLLSPARSDELTKRLFPFARHKQNRFGKFSLYGALGYSPDGYIIKRQDSMATIASVVEYSLSRDPRKFLEQYQTFRRMKNSARATLGNTSFIIVTPASTDMHSVRSRKHPDLEIVQSGIDRADVGHNIDLAVNLSQGAVMRELAENRVLKDEINRALDSAMDGKATEKDIVTILMTIDRFTKRAAVKNGVMGGIYQFPRSPRS